MKDDIAEIREALAAHKREIEMLAVDGLAMQHAFYSMVDILKLSGLGDRMFTAFRTAEIKARAELEADPSNEIARRVCERLVQIRDAAFPTVTAH